jgi:hypothetical protein
MPNHARFGPAIRLKKSKAPSGFVLSSMKPCVMNSGTVELLTFAMRSLCAQNALLWSLFVAWLSSFVIGQSDDCDAPLRL